VCSVLARCAHAPVSFKWKANVCIERRRVSACGIGSKGGAEGQVGPGSSSGQAAEEQPGQERARVVKFNHGAARPAAGMVCCRAAL